MLREGPSSEEGPCRQEILLGEDVPGAETLRSRVVKGGTLEEI